MFRCKLVTELDAVSAVIRDYYISPIILPRLGATCVANSAGQDLWFTVNATEVEQGSFVRASKVTKKTWHSLMVLRPSDRSFRADNTRVAVTLRWRIKGADFGARGNTRWCISDNTVINPELRRVSRQTPRVFNKLLL